MVPAGVAAVRRVEGSNLPLKTRRKGLAPARPDHTSLRRTSLRRTSLRETLRTDGETRMYDIAYLAGGPQRVADAALIALREREAIQISGTGVRAGTVRPRQRLERAVVALCPPDGNRSLPSLRSAVLSSPEVNEIRTRLTSQGLLSRLGHRPTRAGRRQLVAARRRSVIPPYVFDGPADFDGPAWLPC
ncbi:TIGR04222 domain-containing membrane protein [Streptomyces sp. NPDC051322]|uniref:TIGR04222 domain-containing membrane protein n=1 Tax=Streptomyces sp. NPDC051322 TaxID=3154645 RepID=UPI00344FF1FE